MNRLFSLKPTSGPVLTVTLFGRLYEKDSAPNAFIRPHDTSAKGNVHSYNTYCVLIRLVRIFKFSIFTLDNLKK